MLRVYAENQPNRPDAYRITEDILREAVALPSEEISVTVHASDRPDLAALASSDVFVGSGFDVERLRAHAPRLRLVHCTSAGVERYLPLDWLPPGAKFTNSSGIHAQKAREYATMALLILNARLPKFAADQRQRRWAPQLTTSIAGKRVLVVGVGRLGCAAAEAARMLGLQVEGLSKHGRSVDGIENVYPISAIAERIQHCDFLLLCCPLTDETRGLLNAGLMTRMKAGAAVVNMARGPVLVTTDLLDTLRTGHLSGAVLDVFDTEPLPFDAREWDTPNLIVTPHISCDLPTGYVEKAVRILARNIARLRAGEPELENEVNPALGY